MTSILYKSAPLYRLAMKLLYGRHLAARNDFVADLIPPGARVLDLCCGPPMLFRDHLKAKGVHYLGIDINPGFVDAVRRCGADARVQDLREPTPLPSADFVVMQGSLYHFLPEPEGIVDRMLAAARIRAIVSEPVRNLSQSAIPWIARIAAAASDAGSGAERRRFDERSLDAFFARYAAFVDVATLIAGGREKLYVLKPQGTGRS